MITYMLAEILFVLGSLQFMYSSQSPSRMPGPGGRAIFNACGLIAGIGMVGIFVLTFIDLSWWVPFVAWVAGQAAYRLLPIGLRTDSGPGIVFLSAIGGLVCTALILFS